MGRLDGLSVLVTGATSGIGRALQANGTEVAGLVADLASLRETARLADRVLAGDRPIDVLINNAGVGFGRDRTLRETSRDGFEFRFAVNYLTPVLLTRKLLGGGMPTRAVVNVASAGQEALDLDDLQSTRDYDGVRAYRRSKLALIDFTLDLAEESKVAANALHPGTFLDSGMVREAGIHPLGPVSRGAEAILEVMRRSLDGVTGQYFDETEPARPDPQANDCATRRRLRERTNEVLAPFQAERSASTQACSFD